MHPFIVALNGTSRVILRSMGFKPAGHEENYSEEELRIIMTQSFEGGELNESKLEYMENVFSFDERLVKDIMIPRTEVVALDKEMTYKEIVRVLDDNNYTRYPVIEESNKDKIIGVVNVKKMLPHIIAGKEQSMDHFVRSLPSVLPVTPIKEAMLKMQQEQMHMALVIDEYGGTAGILTLEDILEEIVGEIRDEFDGDEMAEIQSLGEHTYLISGRVLLDDIKERFGIAFENSDDIDTIGGWIQYREGTSIQPGYAFTHEHVVWTVKEMDHFQIKNVILTLEVNPS